MKIRVWAVDWCGYDEIFEVDSDDEGVALGLAVTKLTDMYGLLEYENGEYGEFDEFDEDGIPLDDAELTTINAEIYSV